MSNFIPRYIKMKITQNSFLILAQLKILYKFVSFLENNFHKFIESFIVFYEMLKRWYTSILWYFQCIWIFQKQIEEKRLEIFFL